MTAQIAVRDLTVTYRAPGGGFLPALGPVSFTIEQGTFVCLIGPSGCGKSTLIRVIAGLQQPTHGEVRLDGEIITQPSRRVGLMFQEANLMPWRTVVENIALPLELTNVPHIQRYEAGLELLPRLGLSADFADAYPGELSGGMAQRVALGRVLIQHPDVLLLDEPFGALDALTREQISLDLLRVWGADHQTVMMVTHNIHEAILLADRILVFSPRPGQLTADIQVSLPRPRHIEDAYSEAFGELATQVRAAISQE
jgi:ABC-type nitrate/sulfonate/bicarbonate transport system ATPase subunit